MTRGWGRLYARRLPRARPAPYACLARMNFVAQTQWLKMPTESDLLPKLRAAGLVARQETVEFVPLRGGVSSDIVLIRPVAGRPFVVKRALAKLKVKDDWFANPDRNRAEQAWFDYVARFAPTTVPRILHRGPDWFAMEFLGSELVLWK